MEIKEKWDNLHANDRFCPIYPHDSVVRWVFRNFPRAGARETKILDLGCGAGRHAIFLARENYQAYASDFSKNGIIKAKLRCENEKLNCEFDVSEADNLKFSDSYFDGVICYAVIYYLPFARFQKSVQEIHRILKPGGKAFVVIRSNYDSRRLAASLLETHTYRIGKLLGNAPSDVEEGMIMTFLDHDGVKSTFSKFDQILVDRATLRSNASDGETFVDDDWHITLTKS